MRSEPDWDLYGCEASDEQVSRETLRREMKHVRFNLRRALDKRKLTPEERTAIAAALELVRGVAL